ncbi:uncharacterized protein [Rutidosis leptorrhynchoides]|uniref:uncharacterized protein n=1 Tax=Rutidosis leptorrhynchoides TaxID=125765 RepID=UPI003A995386
MGSVTQKTKMDRHLLLRRVLGVRLKRYSSSSTSHKSEEVSLCNGCYWNAMGNWRASSCIMRVKCMAKNGVDLNKDNRHKCRNCRKKSKSGKHDSKGNSMSEGGVKGKFGWVRDICGKERPDIAAFQETKCKNVKDTWVHALWVESASSNEYFLAIRGKWCGSGHESIIVNVYGPHNDIKKQVMWNSLDNLVISIDSAWVVCGDFNEVRNQSDRLNCVFHHSRANRFNEFIARNNLIEIPINGKRFTCISDDGTNLGPNNNFGPKPFKIFDEWLKQDGVDQVVHGAWGKLMGGGRKECIFRDKLKNVKNDLKSWSKSEWNLDREINELKDKATNFESLADVGTISEIDRARWLETRRTWLEKEKIKSGMLKQKARIRWVLEGDENSKPSMGMWAEKFIGPDTGVGDQYISGLEGSLNVGLGHSNEAVYGNIVHINNVAFNGLENHDSSGLNDISGPDMENVKLTNKLSSTYYKVIAKLLSNRLKKVIPNLVGVIFKVNFEKAFDCLNWEYLVEGLKVNYQKSSLIGIGEEKSEVENMANLFRCKVGSTPFLYLGLPVGGNMKKEETWKPFIEKFEKRLSDWRARSISFGGRLTLVKSVLNSLPLYYFSLFRAPPCVIKKLECEFFVKEIGDGASTSFWNEVWIGDEKLKNKFKRLVRLDSNLHVTIKDRVSWDGAICEGNWSWTRLPSGWAMDELQGLKDLLAGMRMNPQSSDSWKWVANGNNNFTTKALTKMINSILLVPNPLASETESNKLVPKKIEVFVWRARKKHLPVLVELDKRCIDLHSVRCP